MDVYRGGREVGGSWAPPDGRGGKGMREGGRSRSTTCSSLPAAGTPAKHTGNLEKYVFIYVRVSPIFYICVYTPPMRPRCQMHFNPVRRAVADIVCGLVSMGSKSMALQTFSLDYNGRVRR